MTPRLLLTGPVNGREPYADAAREAGWESVDWPLLEVHSRDLDPHLIELDPPDWVAVTSSNALPALAAMRVTLGTVSFACVGERTAERLRQLGFELGLEPAKDADELVQRFLGALAPTARAAVRVLWPRGSISNDFGAQLNAGGIGVLAPIAYETRPCAHEGPLPTTDAVFLASPSAVRRYVELVRFIDAGGPRAVAIGKTTLDAIGKYAPDHFRASSALPRAEPAALASCLRELDDA